MSFHHCQLLHDEHALHRERAREMHDDVLRATVRRQLRLERLLRRRERRAARLAARVAELKRAAPRVS